MSKNELLSGAICVLIIVLAVGVTGLGLYVLIAYGSKPINELPAWVVWFFLR